MAGSGTAHLRDGDNVLRVEHLVVEFPGRRGRVVHAVSDVSFDLSRGETLGLVGESGCGKSTTGRAVMRLEDPTSGRVLLDETDLCALDGIELRKAAKNLQMIFQDSVSSLNPRRRVRDIVREGIDIWGADDDRSTDDRVDQILHAVGLDADVAGNRRPHEFSGGQCQRICIARALVMDPEVLILDEPVSALDVSVQAQILNLLEQLKRDFVLTMLFISHDLGVVKNVSDRVIVMYLGKICEIARTEDLYARPAHPYTQALLASIPGHKLDLPPAVDLISGEPPSPLDPPTGCRFRTRCPRATAECATEEPQIHEVALGQFVACHHPDLRSDESA
jgi:peptide/nickel transport system ATP-binding protein